MEFAPAAERDLRKLDRSIRQHIERDLGRLEDDPRPIGVQKLETQEKLYRIPVGPGKNYRAVYKIQDEVLLVLVVKIGDRKEVYRRLR